MAIQKGEKQKAKLQLTKNAKIFGISAAVLGFLALVFLYLAVSKFMLKSNYVEALKAHDGNRRNTVKDSCESALGWGGSHHEVRELLAKVLVEKAQYGQADKEYQELIRRDYKKASVYTGLGVIALRQADAEKDAKKQADLIKTAKDRFGEARAIDDNCMEAHIGMGNADLLAAVKANNKAGIAKAREDLSKVFKRIKDSEDVGRATTREGMIDLYLGLARAHFAAEKYSRESEVFFDGAVRYLPSSLQLQVNLLYLQAQRVAETNWTAEDIKKVPLKTQVNDLKNKYSTSSNFDALVDPWFQFTLAAATAYSRVGDPDFVKTLEYLDNNPKIKNLSLARLVDCGTKLDRAMMPGLQTADRRSAMGIAYSALTKAASALPSDDVSVAAARATVLNNQAFCEEDQAATGSGDAYLDRAALTLRQALDAETKAGMPTGSYETNRNMAVILKRRGKPEAEEYYTKAVKAAESRPEPKIREDVAKLQAYWAGKPVD